MPQTYKLSPSEFGFLWDECQRCYYLQHTGKLKRPKAPMPAIFGKIGRLMDGFFRGRDVAEIAPSLPPGVFELGEKQIQSAPLTLPGTSSRCFISGRFDSVVSFKGGGYAVIDFKTSAVKPENLIKYARQLHAYALALEQSAPGKPRLAPITRLGLFVVEPSGMRLENGGYVLETTPLWMEVQRDDAAFLSFLATIVKTLDQPEPPPADPDCVYCAYREEARATGV
jgi:hypothetical protein